MSIDKEIVKELEDELETKKDEIKQLRALLQLSYMKQLSKSDIKQITIILDKLKKNDTRINELEKENNELKLKSEFINKIDKNEATLNIYLNKILTENFTNLDFYLFMKYLVLKLLLYFYKMDSSLCYLFFEKDKEHHNYTFKENNNFYENLKKIISKLNDTFKSNFKSINNYFYFIDKNDKYIIQNKNIYRIRNIIYFMILYNRMINYLITVNYNNSYNMKKLKELLIDNNIIIKIKEIVNNKTTWTSSDITDVIELNIYGGNNNYKHKYLKYKMKYEELKNNKI